MYKLDVDLHKIAIEKAFNLHDKKDLSIDCVLEGSMCTLFADCLISPAVFLIQNGPFHILAGDSSHTNAEKLFAMIPDGATILPSPIEWMRKLANQANIRLQAYERYSLDHENISITQLSSIIGSASPQFEIKIVDASLVDEVAQNLQFKYHLQNFNSTTDFLNQGLGYVALRHNVIIGMASSALVSSRGYEINIMILPEFRGQSLGKLLAAYLVKAMLKRNKIPHWDAGNKVSLNIAQQLGYDFKERYSAYKVEAL